MYRRRENELYSSVNSFVVVVLTAEVVVLRHALFNGLFWIVQLRADRSTSLDKYLRRCDEFGPIVR